MAQYGTCSNLPTVTAGDVKGILTTRGLECVSENEKSQVDVYLKVNCNAKKIFAHMKAYWS